MISAARGTLTAFPHPRRLSAGAVGPMPRSPVLYVAAVALGGGDLFLGHAGGGWFWVANMSAPWLLIAFAAGSLTRSAWSALAAGGTVTAIALVAFYVCAREPLALVVTAEWHYFLGGALTGPILGLLAFICRRAAPTPVLRGAIIVGCAVVLEPTLLLLWVGSLPNPWIVWIAEAAGGVFLTVWLGVKVTHRRSSVKQLQP
jgi:hypothetical protein